MTYLAVAASAGSGSSNTSSWVPWATLAAAVVAAVVALVGVYFQRKSGREAASAAAASAEAARVSSIAASEAAAANVRLAAVAEAELHTEAKIREDERRRGRTEALLAVVQRLLTPPAPPQPHEHLDRLLLYERELARWFDDTNLAISSTWSDPELLDMRQLLTFRHDLSRHVAMVRSAIGQLRKVTANEDVGSLSISQLAESPDKGVRDAWATVAATQSTMNQFVYSAMRSIRGSLFT